MPSTAAICIAVGNVSLEDCPRLTWSFGWTGSLEPISGAVRDHLVGVHVGLGAAPSLPHDEREVLVEAPVDDLL